MAQTFAFSFDLTNPAQAQAFGAIAAIAAGANIQFAPVGVSGAPAQAQVSAPKKPKKRDYEADPLEEAKDVVRKVVTVPAGKGKVAIRALGKGDGAFGGKLMLKDAGFTWDKNLADDKYKGAWVGTTAQAKSIGLTSKSETLTIPKAWVEKGREVAASKKGNDEQ